MAGDQDLVRAKAFVCRGSLIPDLAKSALSTENPGSVVQAVRLEATDNELFIEMLAAQTFQAMSSGSILARKPEIDLLLRLAGTTQIEKAIRTQGAKGGAPFIAIVAGLEDPKRPPGFSGEELPSRRLNRAELCRIERAALLGAERA
ncbi:MAG: hypothetical protein JRM83_02000 [Nitrososphaerota archaeon]|nr:hypothetical protein [Nitrososphaerota archaeon]